LTRDKRKILHDKAGLLGARRIVDRRLLSGSDGDFKKNGYDKERDGSVNHDNRFQCALHNSLLKIRRDSNPMDTLRIVGLVMGLTIKGAGVGTDNCGSAYLRRRPRQENPNRLQYPSATPICQRFVSR